MSDPNNPYAPPPSGGQENPTGPTMPGAPGYPTYPGMPTDPNQPMYPGAPPSGPLYQGAPPSQPFYPGAPGYPTVTAPPAPKKSRRGLWITLGVIAGLLVLGGGGAAFALVQFAAPAAAAGTFCGDLKAQNYGGAYSLLSSKLHQQLTAEQFSQGSLALDSAEGKVTACGQASGGNAYSYSLGASAATLNAVITRATAGTLQGNIRLVNESGWKIDSLDTALLGVNLGALQAAGAFCQTLQTQDYATLYGLLGSAATTQEKQADFVAGGQLQDQVDGKVTACSLVGLGSGNTDTAASLKVSVTRATLGQRQDTVGLDLENGAWKVNAVGPQLNGTDTTALAVGLRFCTDIASSNYTDIYGLFSDSLKARNCSRRDLQGE